MRTAYMEYPSVKATQVMAFPAHDFAPLCLYKGVLYGVAKAFDGGRCLEEFALDGFPVGGVPLDDVANLGVTCTILDIRERSLISPRSLMNCSMSP